MDPLHAVFCAYLVLRLFAELSLRMERNSLGLFRFGFPGAALGYFRQHFQAHIARETSGISNKVALS